MKSKVYKLLIYGILSAVMVIESAMPVFAAPIVEPTQMEEPTTEIEPETKTETFTDDPGFGLGNFDIVEDTESYGTIIDSGFANSDKTATWTVYDSTGDSKPDVVVVSGNGKIQGDVCDYKNVSNASNITELVIERGISEIGYGAFDGCTDLVKITIPNSVEYIGFYAFRGCSSLADIVFEDTSYVVGNPDLSRKDVPVHTEAFRMNAKHLTIYEGAFVDCPALHTVKLPFRLDTYFSDMNKRFDSSTKLQFYTTVGEKSSTERFTLTDYATGNGNNYEILGQKVEVYYKAPTEAFLSTNYYGFHIQEVTYKVGSPFGVIPTEFTYQESASTYPISKWYVHTESEGIGKELSADMIVSEDIAWIGVDQNVMVMFNADNEGGRLSSKWGAEAIWYPVGSKYGFFTVVETDPGYEFLGWYTEKEGGDKVEQEDMIPMRKHTVYARWKKSSAESTVSLDDSNKGGSILGENKSLKLEVGKPYGTLPEVSTEEGYNFDGWFDKKVGGSKIKEDTIVPAGDHTIYAQWTVKDSPFKDVPSGKYYTEAVKWAYTFGITTGTSATEFGTELPCKRGQIATFQWRAAGEPKPTTTATPFTDTKPGSYYFNAVLWAVENNITTGTGPNTFSPDKPVNRAQVVTFIWRANGSPDVSASGKFIDVPANAYYAKAVNWCVENGITTGTGANTFSPTKDCVRGQIVTFLYRGYVKK